MYMTNQDDGRALDNWLVGVSGDDVRKARDAVLARRAKQMESMDTDIPPQGKLQMMRELVTLMEPSGTILQALKVLGASQRPRRKARDMEIVEAGQDASKARLERITTLANELLMMGEYGMRRVQLYSWLPLTLDRYLLGVARFSHV